MKISENTSISMPMRNLISILGAVAIGVWAYFGVIERLNNIETRATLFEADLLKAADQKPIDQEQYMLLEFTAKQLETIQAEMALCMFVNGSLDGHMMIEGNQISECLKIKREAERNLSEGRENVIRYACGFVTAELKEDAEGNLKIYKIIKDKYGN